MSKYNALAKFNMRAEYNIEIEHQTMCGQLNRDNGINSES